MYKSQYEGVAVYNRSLPDLEGGIQTNSSLSGSTDVAKQGNISAISRVVYEGVAADDSERGN